MLEDAGRIGPESVSVSYKPGGLAELRGVLLLEHEWRVRDGLV